MDDAACGPMRSLSNDAWPDPTQDLQVAAAVVVVVLVPGVAAVVVGVRPPLQT